MESSNNKNSSFDPLKPLVDEYLKISKNGEQRLIKESSSNNKINEENNKNTKNDQDNSKTIINGFIDPSTITSKTEGLPIRSMYDNTGKYFDQYLFNKKFDEYVGEQKKINLTKEKVRLNDLNKAENLKIKPYQLPLNTILINTKNISFDVFDDLISGTNPVKKLYGDNLFYLGILLMAITLIYTSISFIFE